MADQTAKIDANSRASLTGVTNDGAAEIKRILVDPITKRVLVSATITIDGLSDVVITNPQDGQVLTYDSGTGNWINEAVPGGAGTVTSVSVVSANGFAGTVATATTTPAITISTSINSPVLAGNGTAISAATTTGTGSTVVLSAGPTLSAPVLGVATATSLNGLTITATTGTFTLTNAKTLAVTNTLTLSGTDSTVMTFPTTSATIARTDAGQTFTGVQVMTSPTITTSLTTGSSSFDLLNATATTINFGGAATTLSMAGGSGAVINLGGGVNAAELRFLEPSGSGTHYSALKAQAQGANITYTLPATVGASGTVLTDAAGNGTLSWVTPAVGSSTPTLKISTTFETAGRFEATAVNTGTATFGTTGVTIASGTTSASSESLYWPIGNGTNANAQIQLGSPVFACKLLMNSLVAASGAGSSFFGIGIPTVAGAGHTYTVRHIGFKILKAAGVVSLYATQADGTTENASSALTTLVDDEEIDLLFKVNGTTSVDYYFRENNGSLSAATNLTSNLPTSGLSARGAFSISNNSTAFDFNIRVFGADYER